MKLWKAKHEDTPIYGVTRKQAIEWLEEVSEGKARDTAKRYATVMAHLWAWAHRKEEDPPRPADLGQSRKHIHNARIIRDAIEADPEVIPKTIERWQGECVGAEAVRQFRREISCRWR